MVIPMHIFFLRKNKYSDIYQKELSHFKNNYITLRDATNIKKLNIKFSYFIFQLLQLNFKEVKAIFILMNIHWYRKKHNDNYYLKMLQQYHYLFDNVLGYPLDIEQRKAVINDEWNTLILAGAGSGKTLTMIGKVLYLLAKGIDPCQILVISFTNASVNSFIDKIKLYDIKIDVFTFHKLGISIIKDKGVKVRISQDKLLEQIICKYNINLNDQKLIMTFIHLFKSQNLSMEQFKGYKSKTKANKRNFDLITIIEKIYQEYILYLNQKELIDFDDMINLAIKLVDHKSFVMKYKYILVDEYQDTSLTKFNLLKKILNLTNSKLVAVGDDWQSIYRFTGCDLEIFLGFKDNFPDSNIVSINKTYRNSQQLIDIAKQFIMKNPHQLYKKLISDKKISFPVIVFLYNDFNKCLKIVLDRLLTNDFNQNILILGRNNNDFNLIQNKEFQVIDENSFIYKEKMIKYMTVHKSKGLEADNVIIINLVDKVDGFPSKIMNHEILSLICPNQEKYIFDEERRLFYVALTRTKNYVYLLAPANKVSLFVQEIMDYSNVQIIKE